MERKNQTIYMKLIRHILIICFVFAFIAVPALTYGQGIVKGAIKDYANNEPLLAATVLVKGTTMGTVTDYNGEFTMPLKAGEYTLQVSYIGYDDYEGTVTVVDNQTVEFNAKLMSTTILGEEVVVTAQARGQLAAMNQQLRSDKIVNVVSEEKIKELPDQNAAQAVSRLPGVHLDGSKIVVRGIQPKMNKILINGVEMPSTEANNRASSIGMVSANVLSGIEVYKTLTPDMDADAIGGVVNLTLREAGEGFKANVMTQGTYNSQEEQYSNFKVWADASNRILKNKVGLALSLNYSNSKGGKDEASFDYYGETNQLYVFNGMTLTDDRSKSETYGGSFIADYKMKNGKIIFSNILSYTNSESTEYIDDIDLERYRREFQLNRDEYQRLLLNNSISLEQQLGIVKLTANAAYISIDREDKYNYAVRQRLETNAFYASPDSLGSTDFREVMEPYVVYECEVPGYDTAMKQHMFNWQPEIYSENQVVANIDLEIPFNISDNISLKVKTGVKARSMKREYDQTNARYGDDANIEGVQLPMDAYLQSLGHEDYASSLKFPTVQDDGFATNGNFLNDDRYDIASAIDADIMDHIALDLMDYDDLQGEPEMWNEDYWGGENLYAGYLMTDFNLWRKFNIIIGARYESQTNDYVAMEVENRSKSKYFIVDTISKPVTHSNLLPHLHMRYKVTDWFDVRLSYNHTLSRPDYNYVVPKVYYDLVGSTGTAGNPNLKPALSKNIDVNFTFFSSKLGLASVGGFTKQLNDVFYPEPVTIGNLEDEAIKDRFPIDAFPSLAQGQTNFYINNPHKANLRGLEVEWQSNLTHLPFPFNGLVFNINYTKVWSEATYIQNRMVQVVDASTFPPTIGQEESDTTYTGRLLHQADDIANLSIGYDYKGFSARTSFRFQGNVFQNKNQKYAENVFTNNVYKVDFVAKQKFKIKKAKLEVFLNLTNITNAPYQRYQDLPNKGKTNVLTRYEGMDAQLGVRLGF